MADNSPIKKYLNEIEYSFAFRINTGYYLQLLALDTMELLGQTENKKTVKMCII